MTTGAVDVARNEGGTVTLWVLGLCVAVLFLGGLSVDLWRAIAVRRELSAMADAAAAAGASGLDEDAVRAGVVRLDPVRARALALDSLRRNTRAPVLDAMQVDIAGEQVVVTVRDDVPFSLLGVFMGGDDFIVQGHAAARATAVP
jgi:Flp pilus assembly protein TadG